MAKPSKKTIEPLLDEWARLAAKRAKLEHAHEIEVAPLRERYERQCASIDKAAQEKLRPVQERMAELGAEISKQLLAGVDENGTIALAQVATETAIAEVKTVNGARDIDPERFFDQVPPAKRDKRFWECVKIQVGKAEKLLGDVINVFSQKPTTAKVEIKLKSS